MSIRHFSLMALVLVFQIPQVVLAAKPTQQPTAIDPRYHRVFHGEVVGAGHAKIDTVDLLRGVGFNWGDFQNEDGSPYWDGWTSVDLTAPVGLWQVDTYNAQNLDPATIPNHAWWCGQNFGYDCGSGDFGGYGNNWNVSLEWSEWVVDPAVPTTVVVTCVLNHDTEPGYDYLYLEYETSSGWNQVASYDGAVTDVAVNESFVIAANDYAGLGGDEVNIRWRFLSDVAWSDEDCLEPTQGAAQIDQIEVTFNGVPQGVVEDCEDLAALQWQSVIDDSARVGDFAKVWPLLNDADACRSNNTAVVAFIDDGHVVPGTAGYPGTTWTYGPQGYIVNPDGGLAGSEYSILNEIWSPVLEWPGSNFNAALLAFDEYLHSFLVDPWPGMVLTWKIRSTASGNPHEIASAIWQDDNFVHAGSPSWRNYEADVSALLVPNPTYVQIAIGVMQYGFEVLGLQGNDGSAAPYIDNVSLKVFSRAGPVISTREIDLAQDNFPAIGNIDLVALGNNSVRFDSAQDISFPEHQWNDPGDSLRFTVKAVRPGADLVEGSVQLHYWLSPNPLFNPYRTSGLPVSGAVDAWNPIGDTWVADLPDTGFFFPGDVIHYYFQAQDNAAGDIGTTTLPADIDYVDDFSPTSLYPNSFTVRALPSLTDATGNQPDILFINDFGNFGGEDEWRTALYNLGYLEGVDYDQYYVNSPSSAVGNGIGGRATPEQLAGYQTVLYTCGDLSYVTLANGANDPGDDIGVLDSWLRLGDRNLFLTGDNLVFDLARSGPDAAAFLANWIGVNFTPGNEDIRPLIDGQIAPVVQVEVGNSVFAAASEWIAYGGCFNLNRFDAVTVAGTTERLAEFSDPNGNPGSYAYAAATRYQDITHNANVVYFPYGFEFIYNSFDQSGPSGQAMRTQVLGEVLAAFNNSTPNPFAGVPDLTRSSAVSAAAGQVVSVFTRPDGGGDQLRNAQYWDGVPGNPPTRVDATITLTLIDGTDNPVVDYPAEDAWLETTLGGLVLCPGGSTADANTNALGQTTFSRSLAGGGYTDVLASETTQIVVGGDPLNQLGLDIRFNSPDINGSHNFGPSDLAAFAEDFDSGATGDDIYRSDFYYDGRINLSDLVLYNLGYMAECRGEGALMSRVEDGQDEIGGPFQSSEKQLPAVTFGVYTDSEGSQRILYIPQGSSTPFSMYVMLNSDAPVGIGGAAWQFSRPATLDILSSTVPGGIEIGNPATGIIHGLGECGDGRPDVLVLLSEMVLSDNGTPAGVHNISVMPHPSAGLVYADCQGQLSASVTGVTGYLAVGVNAIDINPEPDNLNAPWHLVGPGFDENGTGDAIRSSLPVGDYTLTWGAVPGWSSPPPQSFNMAANEAFTITGDYFQEGFGTVAVDVEPNGLGVSWQLTGPDDFVHDGTEDEVLANLPLGDYTLTWQDIPGWQSPEPNPEIQALIPGETITFSGIYQELGTIVVDVTPDQIPPNSIIANWLLTNVATGEWYYGNGDEILYDQVPGLYRIDWTDVPDWETPPLRVKQLSPGESITFSGLYLSNIPTITSVTDVGNDQGGQVRLLWTRSSHDAPGSLFQITGYEIYRRQDEYKNSGQAGRSGPTDRNGFSRPKVQFASGEKIAGWDHLATVPAHGEDHYGHVVPTLCNSPDGDPDPCWSVFKLRAVTSDPFTNFDSYPDSGYSSDNLAPNVPVGFLVADVGGGGDVALSWQVNEEEDLRHYNLNKGVSPDFLPEAGNLIAQLEETSFVDPGSGQPGRPLVYYKLSAVDVSGNVSPPALVGIATAETPGGQEVHLDTGGGIELTFTTVTQPGLTRIDVETAGPELAEDFQLASDPPLYYQVHSSARFSGPVEVCFQYDESALEGYEGSLRLLQFGGAQPPAGWSDVTLALDPENNRICGETTALSLFTLALSTSGPPPLSDGIESTQLTVDLSSGATTGIALSWPSPPPEHAVLIYRKGFGNYPEFDDGLTPGAVPSRPRDPTAAAAEGWILVSEGSQTELIDQPAVRDFWYYVGFVQNAAGEVSVPSPLNRGTLNYLLGDVSRVSIPADPADPYTGDNRVQIEDVTSLAAAYGTTEGASSFRSDLDLGPTHDGSTRGLPLTDDTIDFDDLILLALNFWLEDGEASQPSPASQNLLVLEVPALPASGQTFSVALRLSADGSLQGVSVPLVWNESVVQPLGLVPGDLLVAQGGEHAILSPRLGTVDAALLGIRDRGISGEGTLTTLQFRVVGTGDPEFGFGEIVARDRDNVDLELATDVQAASGGQHDLPQISALHPNYPNPFNPLTHIRFDLDRELPVRLTVFSVEGKLVRTLVAEQLPAGRHEVQWDGRNDRGQRLASGMYFYRLDTGVEQFTQRMMLVK